MVLIYFDFEIIEYYKCLFTKKSKIFPLFFALLCSKLCPSRYMQHIFLVIIMVYSYMHTKYRCNGRAMWISKIIFVSIYIAPISFTAFSVFLCDVSVCVYIYIVYATNPWATAFHFIQSIVGIYSGDRVMSESQDKA